MKKTPYSNELLMLLICFLPAIVLAQGPNNSIDWVYGMNGDLKDIDIDNKGNTYAAMGCNRNFNIPELTTEPSYPKDLPASAVVKLNTQGRPLWAFYIKNSGRPQPQINELIVAANGDILITGTANGMVSFTSVNAKTRKYGQEKGPNEYHHPSFMFLSRYSSEGDCIWVKIVSENKTGISIAENSQGDLYWSYVGPLENEKTTIYSSQYSILKVSSTGEIIGKHPFHQEKTHHPYWKNTRIVIDPNDALIIRGTFNRVLKFTHQDSLRNIFPIEDRDAFIVKYDAEDHYVWSRKIGGENRQIISDLSVNKKGEIYAAGLYHYECIIENNTSSLHQTKQLYPKGGDHFFYCRYSPDGQLDFVEFNDWETHSVTTNTRTLAIDQNGHTHILGTFFGDLSFGAHKKSLSAPMQDYTTFYSKWNENKLQITAKPIEHTKWASPMDIRCKGTKCVVGGLYHGSIKMYDANQKKLSFAEQDGTRGTFIYSFSIADK